MVKEQDKIELMQECADVAREAAGYLLALICNKIMVARSSVGKGRSLK